MSMQALRSLALSAARGEMRHIGIEPKKATAIDALHVLDDLYQRDPQLLASIWYATASENQLTLFMREWKRQSC